MPPAQASAGASSQVCRIVYEGVTVKLKVTVCTRLPLTAQRVTGTVCLAADFVPENLTVTFPLVMAFVLNEAETPLGKPVNQRLTVP